MNVNYGNHSKGSAICNGISNLPKGSAICNGITNLPKGSAICNGISNLKSLGKTAVKIFITILIAAISLFVLGTLFGVFLMTAF